MILIALALAAPQPAIQPSVEPEARPMEIQVVRDAITDRMRATATLRGDNERIVIRCESPDWADFNVEYHARRWLARGNFLTGQQPVTVRFDGQRPWRRLWHVRDRTAEFDGRGRAISFMQSLMRSRRLVIRTRDVENRTFDSIFNIAETEPAIAQLLETCGSARYNSRIVGQR